MRCKEVMKSGVESLLPGDSALTAARKMRDANIGFLPVVEASGWVAGTVTDRDLVIRVLAAGHPPSVSAETFMSRDPVVCRPEDDLRDAEALMAKHKVSRIVCVDETARLIGVISLSDIAQHESGSRAAETLREVTEREARVY